MTLPELYDKYHSGCNMTELEQKTWITPLYKIFGHKSVKAHFKALNITPQFKLTKKR